MLKEDEVNLNLRSGIDGKALLFLVPLSFFASPPTSVSPVLTIFIIYIDLV